MLHFISILVKHSNDGRNSDWNMYVIINIWMIKHILSVCICFSLLQKSNYKDLSGWNLKKETTWKT
jgi:hypothetical protein